MTGFGTHCCVKILQVNCWVVMPPGNVPLPLWQVNVCDVLAVAEANVVIDPLTINAGQPKNEKSNCMGYFCAQEENHFGVFS